MSTAETDVQETLTAIEQAASGGTISETAVENLRCWLTEDRYASYRSQIVDHVKAGKWQELDDAFLDHHPIWYRWASRSHVPHRLQRDQRPYDWVKAPKGWPIMSSSTTAAKKNSPVPSPTTHATALGTLPNCAPA